MNKLKFTIALAAIIFSASNASASLLGDTVILNIYNSNLLVSSQSGTSVVVSNVVEFSTLTSNPGNFFLSGESINLNGTSIALTFVESLQRSFEITGIDTTVLGAASSSSTVSNITFTASSVRFLYIAGNTASNGTVNITFAATNAVIPEPSTTALGGAGLVAILAVLRKRRTTR